MSTSLHTSPVAADVRGQYPDGAAPFHARIESELRRHGRTLARWRVQLGLGLWGAAALGLLWVFAVSDFVLQFTRAGRIVGWLAVVASLAVGLRQAWIVLRAKPTVESLAATLEGAFPELDNRLINGIQLARRVEGDAFCRAYIDEGVPGWRGLDLSRMKNRRAHRATLMALGLTLVLLVLPWGIGGTKWTTCIARIVNPFSDRPPVSAAQLLAVVPGDTAVAQGGDLVVHCRARGKPSQRILLDIDPDGEPCTTIELGRFGLDDPAEAFHRIPRIAAGLRYRFRAGDAPFPKWYRVTVRAPLAFKRVAVTVTPPPYLHLRPRTFDGLVDDLEVPRGSEVRLDIIGTLPLQEASVAVENGAPQTFTRSEGNDDAWRGEVRVEGGSFLRLKAACPGGEVFSSEIAFRLLPDLPPTIRIVSPTGPVVLPPGSVPAIRFEADDDRGLVSAAIELMEPGTRKDEDGEVVQRWPIDNARAFAQVWSAELPPVARGRPLVFRVTATDTYPYGAQVARSAPITFQTVSPQRAAELEADANARAAATLSALLELQRANLRDTRTLAAAPEPTAPTAWDPVAAQQRRVRELAGKLLADPLRPLGGMTAAMRDVYDNEMLEVIAKLDLFARALKQEKGPLAARCIYLEETILRRLTYADAAADRARQLRKMAGLVELLKALVKGERAVLSATREALNAKTAVPDALAVRQDELAGDTVSFIAACRKAAPTLENNDAGFAALIVEVAAECEARDVRGDMLRAAEHLENNAGAQAVPYEEKVLAALTALLDRMNAWQAKHAEERLADMTEAVQTAKERLEKLRALQAKVLDAMKLTENQADRSDKDMDLLNNELADLQKKINEALLQVPRDLHIYPELSVANETIEDVFTTFELVKQIPGTETLGATNVVEVGVLKPDALLEAMDEAEGRLDDMEMWLADKPETTQYNMEPFDREEMPMMALGALPTSVEDLISSLLKEQEEMAQEAEDSATNLGMGDFPPGWEVAEGPIESFGAQGKSGNQVPDHKEQSGRSIVGRQGQAIGETAAGTGTINEGDKNIEKRMTPEPLQSGQVQAGGEADENATGGGKQASGSADEEGMAGAGSNRRMDSNEPGSLKGLEALLAKTQAAHVKASLMNLHVDSLAAAAHHMRQANDAVARGLPILQVREYQMRAIAALKSAKTELNAGLTTAVDVDDPRVTLTVDDVTETGAEAAPAGYRELVADYFRSLGQ